jgi:hypothetical protein
VDAATNGRNKKGKQYTVLAESERGPMVIQYGNMWACQFHVSGEKKFGCTYQILENFVSSLHERIRAEGKIGISSEFLKNGDPNLKPSGAGMRPFSAPVKRRPEATVFDKAPQQKGAEGKQVRAPHSYDLLPPRITNPRARRHGRQPRPGRPGPGPAPGPTRRAPTPPPR